MDLIKKEIKEKIKEKRIKNIPTKRVVDIEARILRKNNL